MSAMRPVDYLPLLAVPLLLSAGQALFKKTAEGLDARSLVGFIASLLAAPYFWAALIVYGAATLLWVFALSRAPLAVAMPFVALTFVIVPALGALLFGERLTPMYWVGVAVIVAGVCLTMAARPSL